MGKGDKHIDDHGHVTRAEKEGHTANFGGSLHSLIEEAVFDHHPERREVDQGMKDIERAENRPAQRHYSGTSWKQHLF